MRNYHGDGISFQQSNDVTVVDCVSEDNADLGHPPRQRLAAPRREGLSGPNATARTGCSCAGASATASSRATASRANGRFGISIGHKDSDNLLRGNHVVRNASNGVFFRDESAGMSPHRNRLEDNRIEDNGRAPGTAGIRIRGEPSGLIFEDNVIRDTRAGSQRTQTSASWSKAGSARSNSDRIGSRRAPSSTTAAERCRSLDLRSDRMPPGTIRALAAAASVRFVDPEGLRERPGSYPCRFRSL